MESEWDDESLVLVEVQGMIDSDWINKCSGTCKFLGLDSEQPVMQLDRYVFTGTYEDTVGTAIFFQQTTTEEYNEEEEEEQTKTQLHFKHMAQRKLYMKRCFLNDKVEETSERTDSVSEPSTSSVPAATNDGTEAQHKAQGTEEESTAKRRRMSSDEKTQGTQQLPDVRDSETHERRETPVICTGNDTEVLPGESGRAHISDTTTDTGIVPTVAAGTTDTDPTEGVTGEIT